MDPSPGPHHHNSPPPPDLDSFYSRIGERFTQLPEPVLSLAWIRALLDGFLSCQDEFRVILTQAQPQAQRPPLDRFVQDYFDRSVKALDVCNAIRDGIQQIREWKKLLEIVLAALDDGNRKPAGARVLGEGQFRRARKALVDLSISMLDDKGSGSSFAAAFAQRHRSFGRHNAGSGGASRLGQFRSLSWSVSRSWSAARQLQAIGGNLAPPKAVDMAATGGMALAVYAMGSVMLVVMWALVAAIPCQDRGLHMNFSFPRGMDWAVALTWIHERVLEESRKKERRNACCLLREIFQMERCARGMGELVDSVQFPLTPEKEAEVREKVAELRGVYEELNVGLEPLERLLREVFHMIAISRTEGLDSVGRLGQ